MVIHKLSNLEELHNPIKGKLPQVAEYFIKFYGEEHREKISKILKDIKFVFVDPIDENGDTSFQIYFDSIRDNLFAGLNLQLSTKGIKVANQKEFLKNIKYAERLSQDIRPEDCRQVIDLLCAFNTRHMTENLQLLADKTITPKEFEALLGEEGIKSDLEKFFLTVNDVYVSGKFKENFEQLDKDQKRLGFDKKVEYEDIAQRADEQLVRLMLGTIANQFDIQKTAPNLIKISNYLPEFISFFKGNEINDLNSERFYEMFETYYQLSSDKSFHKELREMLDKRNLDFSTPYFKSLRSAFPIFLDAAQKIQRLKYETILERFDDTQDIIKFFQENNCEFDDKAMDMIYKYKFARLDKNSGVDSNGVCVYTIGRDEPHRPQTIIVLNSYLLLLDRTLFHEINHAIQTITRKTGENSALIKVGVPSAKLTFDDDGVCNVENTFDEKGTMFNEILNDYLTEKIFAPARGNLRIGNFVEDDNGLYALGFDFLEKFFEKNLDVLKECAISDDPYSFIKHFDKNDLMKLITLTENLMEDVKRDTSAYSEFVRQRLLMELKQKGAISPRELNRDDFDADCRKFVDYLKEFDTLADEIKPISHSTAKKEELYDEFDDGRDE